LAPLFKRVILNDKQEYLIELYKALQNGWTPPESLSEEQYRYVKEHKNEKLYDFAGRVIKVESEYNKPIGGKVYSTFLSDERDDVVKKLFRDLYSILIRTPLINNEEIRLLLRDANV
jgi:hypothetical protein